MKKLLLAILFCACIQWSNAQKPNLSFFCELPGKEFNELFADSALIEQLVRMKAAIRIGLHDFSDERTQTIKKLNQAGIPVVAWLLLPEQDGYWFNMYNGAKAEQRYADFKKWTTDNQLIWKGIGIDLELDINDATLVLKHPWRLAWKVYKRLYDSESLAAGKEIYQRLINTMKADGFTVESYIIPIVFEERTKKTSSFQKLMGIVDIQTDIEIPMLYTSAMNNPAIIPAYHQPNMPLALGSTGGGVKIEGIELKALSWENLERDILIASKLTNEVHVFCLETSVAKGFLDKIEAINYNQPMPDIKTYIGKEKSTAKVYRFLLVVFEHPFILTLVLVGILSGIIWVIYKLLTFIFKKVKK